MLSYGSNVPELCRTKSRTDYESSIKNNPIELLKAIKQHALNYQ
jgi:hypothetical protein